MRAWSSSINVGWATSSSAWGKIEVTVSFGCLIVVGTSRVTCLRAPIAMWRTLLEARQNKTVGMANEQSESGYFGPTPPVDSHPFFP